MNRRFIGTLLTAISLPIISKSLLGAEGIGGLANINKICTPAELQAIESLIGGGAVNPWMDGKYGLVRGPLEIREFNLIQEAMERSVVQKEFTTVRRQGMDAFGPQAKERIFQPGGHLSTSIGTGNGMTLAKKTNQVYIFYRVLPGVSALDLALPGAVNNISEMEVVLGKNNVHKVDFLSEPITNRNGFTYRYAEVTVHPAPKAGPKIPLTVIEAPLRVAPPPLPAVAAERQVGWFSRVKAVGGATLNVVNKVALPVTVGTTVIGAESTAKHFANGKNFSQIADLQADERYQMWREGGTLGMVSGTIRAVTDRLELPFAYVLAKTIVSSDDEDARRNAETEQRIRRSARQYFHSCTSDRRQTPGAVGEMARDEYQKIHGKNTSGDGVFNLDLISRFPNAPCTKSKGNCASCHDQSGQRRVAPPALELFR